MSTIRMKQSYKRLKVLETSNTLPDLSLLSYSRGDDEVGHDYYLEIGEYLILTHKQAQMLLAEIREHLDRINKIKNKITPSELKI